MLVFGLGGEALGASGSKTLEACAVLVAVIIGAALEFRRSRTNAVAVSEAAGSRGGRSTRAARWMVLAAGGTAICLIIPGLTRTTVGGWVTAVLAAGLALTIAWLYFVVWLD
jgi:hypothetical protein